MRFAVGVDVRVGLNKHGEITGREPSISVAVYNDEVEGIIAGAKYLLDGNGVDACNRVGEALDFPELIEALIARARRMYVAQYAPDPDLGDEYSVCYPAPPAGDASVEIKVYDEQVIEGLLATGLSISDAEITCRGQMLQWKRRAPISA